MSGSRHDPADRHLAEQHLGDRLAALVDGELSHDSRERVLAHLATCAKCKAEADAQRSLKTYFASTAPPPPSETFLARLQGLPAGGDDDRGGFGGGPVTDAIFGVRPDSIFNSPRDTFGYDPSGAHGGVLPGSGLPDGTRERGFRIHDVGRSAQERAAASRGRRFAFAAAGAVSLAAIALGGVSTGAPAAGDASADPRGSKASPMRTQGSNSSSAREAQRRRGGGPPVGAQQAGRPGALAAPMAASGTGAPQLPGAPFLPHRPRALQDTVVSPMLAGSTALSPLIRRPATGFPQFPVAAAGAGEGDGKRSGASKARPSPSASATLSSRR
ncbi:anti-sigma factor [Streptomyces boluensis]|uniref:Zf-HC2 domain-containing protein n=1 Tax=Streptomyces boluensis TaxID=1775135 RepID=A0A964XKP4_9ACTN|nr:anti-sigma factor [Streptomyces boluensis]NBE52465.1 zf-HC2 domain-containing protein [Streptomyces boluensis]